MRSKKFFATSQAEHGLARVAGERNEETIEILKAQKDLLAQLVSIYERMTSMVLQGADVSAMTRLLADLIQRSVSVFDPMLVPLAEQASPVGEDDQHPAVLTSQRMLAGGDALIREVLATLEQGKRPVRMPLPDGSGGTQSYVLAPIIGGGDELLGYLVLTDAQNLAQEDELDLLAAQHASALYALVLMRQQIATELGNKLRGDLVEGLIRARAGEEEVARERALYLGYDPRSSYRVLVMTPEGVAAAAGGSRDDTPTALALRRRVLDVLVDFIGSRFPKAIAATRQGEAVVVTPDPEQPKRDFPSPVEMAQIAQERLRQLFPSISLTVGIGGPCTDASELARSYGQAHRVIAAARRFGRGGDVTRVEDLGIYRLLYQVGDQDELRGFADSLLGPLVEYDRIHGSDLLHTLDIYLCRNGSIQAAARDLFVHGNTVGYRIRRIQRIAHIDLDDNDTRLSVQIALKIVEGWTLDAGAADRAEATPLAGGQAFGPSAPSDDPGFR